MRQSCDIFIEWSSNHLGLFLSSREYEDSIWMEKYCSYLVSRLGIVTWNLRAIDAGMSFIIEKLYHCHWMHRRIVMTLIVHSIIHTKHTLSDQFYKRALFVVSEFISVFVNNWVILRSSTILRWLKNDFFVLQQLQNIHRWHRFVSLYSTSIVNVNCSRTGTMFSLISCVSFARCLRCACDMPKNIKAIAWKIGLMYL